MLPSTPVVLALCYPAIAFSPSSWPARSVRPDEAVMPSGWIRSRCRLPVTAAKGETQVDTMDRVRFLRRTAAASVAAVTGVLAASSGMQPALSSETMATEFVDFVDSRGLFGCLIPKNFLRAERPKDKRGTVFVAGDFSKAEVMSVQVVTTFDLLTDAGLPTIGDLTKWESVGTPTVIADLLKQRRDSDAAGGGQMESVVLPGEVVDGDVLQFTLKSPIKVMRSDLLEKEQGVSELYRNTYVKAIMRGDGSFLVLWAGALNTNWDQEGGAKERLKVAADSFRLEGLVVDGVRLGAA